MANAQLLEEKWKASGKTKTYLAKKINVSRPRLDYIFSHPASATVGQADSLSKEMNILSNERKDIFYP